MIDDTHRTRVLEEMPEPKAREKQGRSVVGLLYSLVGTALAFGGLFAAVRYIDGGAGITMWPVILIGGIVAMGVTLVFYGGNLVSRELTRAFFNDLSVTITKVWRRNGSSS